jgi:hypothetical protein
MFSFGRLAQQKKQLSPTERIDRDISYAVLAAGFSGFVELFAIIYGRGVPLFTKSGPVYFYFNAWNSIDVAITFALAFGVYKRSRVCSVFLVLYAIIWVIVRIALDVQGVAATAGVIYLFFFFRGLLQCSDIASSK